jgi:hypothetical protein
MKTWKIYEREHPAKHFITDELSEAAVNQLMGLLTEHGAFTDPVLEDVDEARLIAAKENISSTAIEWEN